MSTLNTRLQNITEKLKHLPCLTCKEWMAYGHEGQPLPKSCVCVVEDYSGPRPYPQYCPDCGRLTYDKVILRSMWEAI